VSSPPAFASLAAPVLWLLALALLVLKAAAILAAIVTAGLALIWALEERRGAPAPRARPAVALALCWLLEWLLLTGGLLATSTWWLRPRRPTLRVGGSRPVLAVAGWGLGPFSMALFARRLRARGREVLVLSPATIAASPKERAAALGSDLAEILRGGATACDIVAHGDSGVALRAALLEHPDLLPAIGNVVTLGAPHGGTVLGHLARGTRWASLRPGSHWLAELAENNTLADGHRHVTAIASSADAVVCPAEFAWFDPAFNIRVDLVGHLALLVDRQVFDLTVENLEHGVV
jgi:triacylglycerol lipase